MERDEGAKEEPGFIKKYGRFFLGPLFALGSVGIIAFLFLFMIPNLSTTNDGDWNSVESEGISLYYREELNQRTNPEKILSRLVSARGRIVEELEISGQEKPEEIRVYFHPDSNSLRSELARRKSSAVRDTPLGLIDLTSEEELLPLLTRLLTTFAWGSPSSEFLRQGVQYYFTEGSQSSIYRTYGLGDLLFSLEEIATLERTNNYPVESFSRLFDEFDSPNSPAGLSLSLLSEILHTRDKGAPHLPYLREEATSFVYYVLDNFGSGTLKAYWNSNSLVRGGREIFGEDLVSLQENWLNYVNNKSLGTEAGKYYKGFYKLTQGEFLQSLDLLREVDGDGVLGQKVAFQTGKSLFFTGEIAPASEKFAGLELDGIDPRLAKEHSIYRELTEVYLNGATCHVNGVKLIVPADETVSSHTLKRLKNTLRKGKYLLREPESQRSQFTLLLLPRDIPLSIEEVRLPDTVAAADGASELNEKLADLIIESLTRTATYSGLLKHGLYYYLTEDDLEDQAEDLLREESWEPVNALVFKRNSSRNTLVEGGLFVDYLIKEYGIRSFLELLYSTTPLGGDNSLKGGLLRLTGGDLESVEEKMLEELKRAKGSDGPTT
ncbi:MAG: hypothetical protein ACLFVS_02335 [Candidatus Acetothermia bacterium]